MGTSLPADASRTNCDSATDDPELALLVDLFEGLGKFNSLKAALGVLARHDIGEGLDSQVLASGTPDKLRTSIKVVSKSAAYTVVAADRAKLIDCTGTFTLSLTAAATLGDGFWCAVRNSGSGTVTVDPNLSELINGAQTQLLYPGQGGLLVCNGSSWRTVGLGDVLPVGMVSWFATSSAPTGWLKANGAAVSRSTYAALFGVIGTTFGAGDGSTTFNLPDLRGEFIRGWDNGRGVDSGRAFGSFQADDFKSHTHVGQRETVVSTPGYPAGVEGAFDGFRSGNVGATGGAETRPRNVALLACIKY
ncbi:MAG: phage tail protein [Thermosphaera sp.]